MSHPPGAARSDATRTDKGSSVAQTAAESAVALAGGLVNQSQSQAQPQTKNKFGLSANTVPDQPATTIDTQTVKTAKKPGILMTFKKPQPSTALIKALVPVNRWLHLGGIPGLRSIPGLGRVPGIRGLMNIPRIDFPKSDENRLAAALHRKNATFVVPNHPEFFTDWMLDKEVMTRVSPLVASWATHSVVNGMGGFAQKFWLKNNLIAQIPGVGGAAGKAYSIDWALRGHGVLLHPEGGVGWHADLMAPLYPGAVDMAIAALGEKNRRGEEGQVFVAPLIWKLKFMRDVEPALHKELDYIEQALGLPLTKPALDLAQRLYAAYDGLLARNELNHDIHPTRAPYFERQEQFVAALLTRLNDHLDGIGVARAKSDDSDELIRRGERWLRSFDAKSLDAETARGLTKDLRLALRFRRDIYPADTLTQEQVAESIKRIRNDYCTGTRRDAFNSFVPQPAGSRIAHIRVPEPIEITEHSAAGGVDALVEELRNRMQSALDEINHDLDSGKLGTSPVIKYANPFVDQDS